MADDDDEYTAMAEAVATHLERMQPAIGIVTAFLANDTQLKIGAIMDAASGYTDVQSFADHSAAVIFGLAELASLLAAKLAEERGVPPEQVVQDLGTFAARSDEMRAWVEERRRRRDDDA